MKTGLKFGGIFRIVCYDKDGVLKWEDNPKNLVMDEGLAHIMDATFSLSGVTPYAAWYIGLTDGGPTVAASDTLVDHAGWAEVTEYDQASRQEFVKVRTNLSVDNLLSKAVFTINSPVTVGGAFIASEATGSAGVLMSAAAFESGDKIVSNGDTIEVSYEFASSSL